MKTIKTKKSVGKAYVFSYCFGMGTPYFISNGEKDITIEERDKRVKDKNYNRISEISEVELFETVEEQVPEIGRAWVFSTRHLRVKRRLLTLYYVKMKGRLLPVEKDIQIMAMSAQN